MLIAFLQRSQIPKPTSSERVIGRASLVWADIKDLGLAEKPVSKWTVKQRESFIRAINKYSCITGKGDEPGGFVFGDGKSDPILT